jgi:hypothetical protein
LALGFLATEPRSDVLTLSPPADLAPGLVDALDHLRGSAGADRRAELDALGSALAGGGAVSARRDLVGELLAVAIDETGERVAAASVRLVRGDDDATGLRGPLDALTRLLDLYESVAG